MEEDPKATVPSTPIPDEVLKDALKNPGTTFRSLFVTESGEALPTSPVNPASKAQVVTESDLAVNPLVSKPEFLEGDYCWYIKNNRKIKNARIHSFIHDKDNPEVKVFANVKVINNNLELENDTIPYVDLKEDKN